jgi:hypothetical protein
MNKKTVHVSVVGHIGVGKSGVIQLISRALQDANIETKIDWGMGESPSEIDPRRIGAIATKTTVTIHELQVGRRALPQESADVTTVEVLYDHAKGYGVKLGVMGIPLYAWFGEFDVSYQRAKMIATRLSSELGTDYIDTTPKKYDWVQPQ